MVMTLFHETQKIAYGESLDNSISQKLLINEKEEKLDAFNSMGKSIFVLYNLVPLPMHSMNVCIQSRLHA